MRRGRSMAGKKVLDLAEPQACDGKSETTQRRGKGLLRAGIFRGDGRTADQRLGEAQRIGEVGQSRSNSLIEVFALVWASTRLTMTAQ